MRLKYRLGTLIWTVPEREFKFFRFQKFTNLPGCFIYAQNKRDLVFLEMFFKGKGYNVELQKTKQAISIRTYLGYYLYYDERIYVSGKEDFLKTLEVLREKYNFRTGYEIMGNPGLYIIG